MFKIFTNTKFKNKDDSVQIIEKPLKQSKEIINSAYIQKDLKESLDKLLNESGINYSRQSEIDNLRLKLDSFRIENETLYKKIELLNNLGFTSTPSTITQKKKLEEREQEIKTEIRNLNNEIMYYEELDDYYKKYSLQYPTFKFIPTKLMNEILKKYNLFLGDTCFYGKEIPMDALEIASGFTSEINESKYNTKIIKSTQGHSRYNKYIVEKEEKKLIKETSSQYDIGNTGIYISDPRRSDYYNSSTIKTFSLSKLKIVAPMNHFSIPTVQYEGYSGDGSQEVAIVKIDNNNHLQINVNELNAKAIEEAKKIAALDPILMLEVSKGYIILKAWDEEADIIEIQNENLN